MKNRYPLPLISETLNRLNDIIKYIKLNLKKCVLLYSNKKNYK